MIKVLFFGQLKDQVQTGSIEVAEPVKDVANLKQALVLHHPQWSEYLSADSTLVAVNQTIGNESTSLVNGDEVAFFPPVTGG